LQKTSLIQFRRSFSDAQAAPLLCAGAIGYRSLRLTGLKDGQRLGFVRLWRIRSSGFEDGESIDIRIPRFMFFPKRQRKERLPEIWALFGLEIPL